MALVQRSYRIRAYPNGAQQRLIGRWLGAVWSRALEARSEGYRHFGLRLTGNDISRWLTQWKRTAGHEWLAEVPATCLTQMLRDQDRAFTSFFPKRAPGIRPERSMALQEVSGFKGSAPHGRTGSCGCRSSDD